MSSPLAWQGDGPPQTLPSSSLPHYSEQFDTSYSVASLTFVAAQLSTLLHTITVASSATASTPLNPHPTNLTSPAPYSPSSAQPPLSNSLTLCHSNLLTALSHIVSTSFHLLTLPAHPTAPLPSLPLVPLSLYTPSSCPTSPPSTHSIAIPPRFTIRVVTDLEPVTSPTSRSHSPSPSKPSSAPHSSLTPSSSSTAVQSDAPIAVQNDVVVKATLHLVSATATSPVSEAHPVATNQEDDECSSPTPLPTTLPSATDSSIHPSTPTLTTAPSSPSTPSPPPTPTPTPTPTPAPSATSSHSVTTACGADSTVSADEIDVDAQATSHSMRASPVSLRDEPWHWLSCSDMSRRELNRRHDAVADAVSRVAWLVGAQVKREVEGLDPRSHQRPDVLIAFPGRLLLTDVAVSHSLTPNYVAQLRSSAAIQQLRKNEKYARVATRIGAELMNVSVDACGGLASDAFRLVQAIGEEGERWSMGTWSKGAIERHLLSAISVAVQRGNALTMLCGFTRTRSGERASTQVDRRGEDEKAEDVK